MCRICHVVGKLCEGRRAEPAGGDRLQPGSIRVLDEDGRHRRSKRVHRGVQDGIEGSLQVAGLGDAADRGDERGSGIAGRSVGRHARLLRHSDASGPHRTPRRFRIRRELTSVGRGADTLPVKLVVAIVHNEDAGALVNALLDKEFRATRVNSAGGFLKQSNATIMLGVEDADVDEVLGIVRANCTSRTQVVNPMPPIMEPGEFFMPYPLEVEVGGATVFVLPVDRFERL